MQPSDITKVLVDPLLRNSERLRVTYFKHMFVMTLDSTMEYTGYIKAYKNHIIHLVSSAKFNLHISFSPLQTIATMSNKSYL